jgi:hypothetical protein
MRAGIFAAAALLACLATAADRGVKAQFVGGTLPGVSRNSDAVLGLTDPAALSFRSGKVSVTVSWNRINSVEYGQNVSRRYAAGILISPVLLLSKSRKHFVTLGYADSDDRQQALVLRVSKGDIRVVLAALQARTGRRVEYQDDEARKSLKD